jgi:hypothetical protein
VTKSSAKSTALAKVANAMAASPEYNDDDWDNFSDENKMKEKDSIAKKTNKKTDNLEEFFDDREKIELGIR